MNMNEVLASLAGRAGTDVHPNDHVNASQSSNDTFPTAIHVAAAQAVVEDLQPALAVLHDSLRAKAEEFAGLVKSGRTHLMDATPVMLGQELGGYAATLALAQERLDARAAPGARAAARRHRGRHRHQHPGGLRRRRDRGARRADRPAVHRGPRPLRGPGQPRLARRAERRAADGRGRPHQDLQRPALDGQRTDHRAGRDPAARPAAGVEHHARQGQPGAAGGDADGLRAGGRQRRDRGVGRRGRQLRAQRDDAGDRPQRPRVGPAARRPAPGSWPSAASTASRPTPSGCGRTPSPPPRSSPRSTG